MYYCILFHTSPAVFDSVQPLNKSPDGGQDVHCCCSDMPTLTLLSVCVQDLSSSWLPPLSKTDNLSHSLLPKPRGPTGSASPARPEEEGQPDYRHPADRLCGGETQADKQKGVCRQEALIAASAIRVMKPDGRTVW